MNIYWLESLDHSEDWFVAAASMEQAVTFFSNEMGYHILNDKVQASLICPAPTSLYFESEDFLANEDIIACGGEFIEFHDQDLLEHIPHEFLKAVAGETRIVRFGRKVFMEGNVMRVALQMEGKLTNS